MTREGFTENRIFKTRLEGSEGELYDSLGKGPPGKESAGAKALRQKSVLQLDTLNE